MTYLNPVVDYNVMITTNFLPSSHIWSPPALQHIFKYNLESTWKKVIIGVWRWHFFNLSAYLISGWQNLLKKVVSRCTTKKTNQQSWHTPMTNYGIQYLRYVGWSFILCHSNFMFTVHTTRFPPYVKELLSLFLTQRVWFVK